MEFKYTRQFQEKIISVALASEDNLRNLVAIIEPKYFTVPICQTAWYLIKKIFQEKYIKVSYESLSGFVAKTGKFSDEEVSAFYGIIKNTNNSDEQLVIDEIYDFCKQANFLLTINNYIDTISAGKCDWQDLYGKLNDVFSKDYDKSYVGIDYFEDIAKHKRMAKNMGREGVVPTTFPVDGPLNGGLGKKEVGIIVAPTGRGKSTMLLNFALGCIQNKKNVLFISCELSENFLMYQLDKCFMYTFNNMVSFVEEDLMKKLQEVKEATKAKMIIREYLPGELTAAEIYNIYKDLTGRGYHFDVIIIDYIGEMKLPRADREDLSYKKMTTQLKKLASQINLPIWTAHQTGRASHEKAILTHKDISDAFSILRVVDVGITMGATEDEWANGICRMSLIKNRFGPSQQTFNLKFLGEVAKFIPTDSANIREDKDSKIMDSL
jgi:archaellum biogenesis ATPase FlaH